MRWRLIQLSVCLVLSAALAPSAALARVPEGFVGAMADGPIFNPRVSLGHEFDMMVAGGVESVRAVFDWRSAQPYESFTDVPADQVAEFENVGGVPTRFVQTDQVVALAVARGLSILPVVQYAPNWDSRHPGHDSAPPASSTPYANFLTALIHRYGPSGAFWTEYPRLPRRPIRWWQIWNEPNIKLYWSDQPHFEAPYVKLLRAAHDAIKAADPGAKVVMAGMPDFTWRYLATIYKMPGARRLFDVVAVHPYTAQAEGVIVLLKRARAVMNEYGDAHKPMLATEISWPSSIGILSKDKLFGFESTDNGQALRLERLLPLLARDRVALGLMGFYYYTWMGREEPGALSFDYAGLLRFRFGKISVKPAFAAFTHTALAIEACRRKGNVATRCLRSAG